MSNAYWDVTRTGQASAVGVPGTAPLTQTNVNSAAIGSAGTTYPNLSTSAWGFNNGTPYLLAIPGAATSAPIYISLNCGLLCNNTYGDNVSLTFG
ncbi:hypothetical protein ABTB34_20510, partial [Acinetobacter baumannii]